MFGAKLTTALVIGAAVWPAGAYASTDPPSPVVPNAVAGGQDLRSPDARDAAREVAIAAPTATHADVSATGPTASVSDGFEWGDAGIGAAVILGLVSLASAAVLVTGRGRGGAPAGPHA